MSFAAWSGPGHDHGPAPAAQGVQSSPRVAATSEAYQLVGIVAGEVMVIYIDRYADNAPVTSAQLEVTIGDVAHSAIPTPKGTYEVKAPILKQPGTYNILATIGENGASDLLVGSLTVAGEPAHDEHTIWSHLPSGLQGLKPLKAAGFGVGGVIAIIGFAGLLRSRAAPLRIAVVVAGLSIMAAAGAFAHEGEEHAPAVATNGDAPQRRADGKIFLPKPSQRLLEIRTRVMAAELATRSVRHQGRIVANPNRSGIVQSTIQGRFTAPPGGVPAIGTRVKAGDNLGSVAPSFISKDASDIGQTLRELDQQIALTRNKLERQEQLYRAKIVSNAVIEELNIQMQGLATRRKELLESRVQPEELRAPVDGVITSVRVVAGQVVSQADQLFQIVDPTSLYIEALQFDTGPAEDLSEAVASWGDGRTARLRLLGRGRSLEQQYAVLKFEVIDPPADLNVGMPVIVLAGKGAPVSGLRLPRSAVTQAPNGQSVVFVHLEPEVFEPRAVRFEPFDAATVTISAGLEPGEKVVVQNAPLVNQVR